MEQEKKMVYEKPVLRVIELAAEETMSVNGCKTKTLGGPFPPGCVISQPCASSGS